jgi:hypothetical protein
VQSPDDVVAGLDFRGDDLGGLLGCRAAVPVLPYHRWLEEPFQEGVSRDWVTLGAHAGEDIYGLVTISRDMVEF